MRFLTKVAFSLMCISLTACGVSFFSGCSSGPEMKKQEFADVQTSKVLEYDYEQVWKGVKAALAEYHLKEMSSEDGKISTDWVYSTSSDKYISVKVNQQPRRKYLQGRYRFHVSAKKQIIGVLVSVTMDEEIEKLSQEGAFQSWKSVDNLDTKRAHEVLEKIEIKTQEMSGR